MCPHVSLFLTAFIFILSNVPQSTGSQPPGLEFVRPVLPESKLVGDGFACLASEDQEQKQESKKTLGAGQLESAWLGRVRGAGNHCDWVCASTPPILKETEGALWSVLDASQ